MCCGDEIYIIHYQSYAQAKNKNHNYENGEAKLW